MCPIIFYKIVLLISINLISHFVALDFRIFKITPNKMLLYLLNYLYLSK